MDRVPEVDDGLPVPGDFLAETVDQRILCVDRVADRVDCRPVRVAYFRNPVGGGNLRVDCICKLVDGVNSSVDRFRKCATYFEKYAEYFRK